MSVKIAALALSGLVALLAACGVPPPRSSSERAAPAATATPDATARVQGTPYRIDTARSELRVLVYRAGALANLGHNHVIVNRAMTGSADYSAALTGSTFAISIPVSEFSVDETALRAAEGADFPGAIPDEAKSGTRRNMLGTALLDAARYPTIDVRGSVGGNTTNSGSTANAGGTTNSGSTANAGGTADSGSAANAGGTAAVTATLEATIAGHVSTLTLPLTLQRNPGEVVVAGSMTVRQTDLGLTPFSIMLGALQVQDEIHIKFAIVAVPAG